MQSHDLFAQAQSDTRTGCFLVVKKKGTKILSKTVGRIPSPLSDIANVGLPLEKKLYLYFFYLLSARTFRGHFLIS